MKIKIAEGSLSSGPLGDGCEALIVASWSPDQRGIVPMVRGLLGAAAGQSICV